MTSTRMRVEDPGLLRGEACFVGDLVSQHPDVLHAAFVRSSVAAGTIEHIDVEAARSQAGVLGVWTFDDLTELGPLGLLGQPDERFATAMHVQLAQPAVPAMAAGAVRYVGEPVAVVIAEDRYLAEDAAAMVSVTYDPLPPVLNAEDALADGAPVVNPECADNVAVRLGYEVGDPPGDETDGLLVHRRLRIGRQTALPMECRGVLAEPRDDGGVQVASSSQVPFMIRRAICETTGWDPSEVRVWTPEVGGGFGQKAAVYGEELVLAVMSRRLGRAVAWLEDRYENLLSATHARDQVLDARLMVDADGRILSWDVDYTIDLGAHNFWMLGVVANTAMHLFGPYRIPAARVSAAGFFSNKAPTAQYRGAGRPEATFALERCLDEAARRLGIETTKIRDINLLTEEDLPYPVGIPYRDGVPIVYDGKDYRRVLQHATRLLPEEEVTALRQAAPAGHAIGVGVATYMEATARGPREAESARITLRDDGTFEVSVGVGTSGQSHRTVLAALAADVLGVHRDQVQVVTGDTDRVGQGMGSFASRVGVIAGSAVDRAARSLAERAGQLMPGGDGTTWQDLASRLASGGDLEDHGPLTVEESFAPATVTWTMGAHLAVVDVDRSTGQVRVLRYVLAHEGGPSLDERVVEGQLRGGIAQGIGMALLEEFTYDGSGQPTTATLADYRIPESSDVPAVRLAHLNHPSQLNPLGIKGVGESGVIAGAAVICGAVEDALPDVDLTLDQTPLDADELLLALAAART